MDGWQEKPTGGRVEIGRRRKDGLYPVKFVFTGRTITKIMTWDQAMTKKAEFAPKEKEG